MAPFKAPSPTSLAAAPTSGLADAAPPRSAKLPISTLLHCIQFTANHCNAQGLVVSNVKPGGTFDLQHENPKCALLCGQHLMLMFGKIYGEP